VEWGSAAGYTPAKSTDVWEASFPNIRFQSGSGTGAAEAIAILFLCVIHGGNAYFQLHRKVNCLGSEGSPGLTAVLASRRMDFALTPFQPEIGRLVLELVRRLLYFFAIFECLVITKENSRLTLHHAGTLESYEVMVVLPNEQTAGVKRNGRGQAGDNRT
jgi:hypothetical protein